MNAKDRSMTNSGRVQVRRGRGVAAVLLGLGVLLAGAGAAGLAPAAEPVKAPAAAAAAPATAAGSPAENAAARAVAPAGAMVPAASDLGEVPAGATTQHAWFVAPGMGGFPAAVMHIPPRDGRWSVEGTVKLANVFNEEPVALMASGAKVLVVLPSGRGGETTNTAGGSTATRTRRVVSMTAWKTAGGTWEYRPLGRTGIEPELPGTGRVVDVCWSPKGPLVLLGPQGAAASPLVASDVAPDSSAAQPWRLMRLGDGKWEPVALPGELGLEPASVVRLVGTRSGAEVWAENAPGSGREPGTVSAWAVPAKDTERPEPVRAMAGVPGGLAGTVLLAGRGEGVLAVRADATGVTVMSRLPAEGAGAPKLGTHEAWRTVTRVSRENKEAPEQREWPMAVLSLLGLDRVAVVTAEAKLPQVGGGTGTAPGAGPRQESGTRGDLRSLATAANRSFAVTELSTGDGRVMFSGAAKREGVVTTRDFHLLMLAFASMMVAVLLFVLRSDKSRPVVMPEGSSLASGAKRAVATGIDAFAVLLLAGPLLGISVTQLISAQTMLNPGNAIVDVLGVMALGMVHGTISEALWGRTIGKFVTGCEVAGFVRRRAEKVEKAEDAESDAASDKQGETAGSYVVGVPMLWQAGARNAVKWLLWPLSLVALFDATARHPGDVIGQTVVVEFEEEEGEE